MGFEFKYKSVGGIVVGNIPPYADTRYTFEWNQMQNTVCTKVQTFSPAIRDAEVPWLNLGGWQSGVNTVIAVPIYDEDGNETNNYFCLFANPGVPNMIVGLTRNGYQFSNVIGGTYLVYSGYFITSKFTILNGHLGNEDVYMGLVTASRPMDSYTGLPVLVVNVTDYLEKYLGAGYHIEGELGSDEYGEASGVGGYGQDGALGTFDDSSDHIGLPPVPGIGVSSVGFVNVYDISAGGLASFGMDLFPDLNFTPIGNLPAPADVTDAIVNMATVLTTFGNQIPNMIDMYINKSLIDYIIDCHIIPVSPSVGGSENIKVGFKTFNQVANRVSSDYIDFDCGSLNIGEYYANFADYEPYTRCKLFLPFVGFVDLKPEFWQSGTIKVKYRFNVIDGSFTAFVLSTSSKSKLSDTVIAQYGGNCCVHIPITGANYSNLVSGVVGGATAVMAAQPGTGGSAALDAAVNLANTKANVQQSNSYNATTSFLGVRKPYLMIERTVSNMSSAYPDEIGIPCNINLDFSNLSGLVKSQDVILDGITGATDAELKEIARLLAGGVYF